MGVRVSRGNRNYGAVRSYAAQLFDATAINMVLSGRGYRYEQPTEQEVTDGNEKAQGWVVSQDGKHRYSWAAALHNKLTVLDSEVVKLNNWVIGHREVGFLIAPPILTEQEAADPKIRKFYDFSNRDSGLATLYSPAELSKVLQTIEQDGQWPPIASVDTKAAPFSKTDGGGHNLVITAESANGVLISFDNTLGQQADHNGPPSVDTVTFGKAILASHASGESTAASLKSLIDLSTHNKTAWDNFKKGWLELPEKLAAGNRQQVLAAYLQTHQDGILIQWQKDHPEDKNLALWKETLLQWLSKYPEEKPNVSK